jgi:hypothetical protein
MLLHPRGCFYALEIFSCIWLRLQKFAETQFIVNQNNNFSLQSQARVLVV